MDLGEIISTLNAFNVEGPRYHPEHIIRVAWRKEADGIHWSGYKDDEMVDSGVASDLTAVLVAHAMVCRAIWR